MSMFAFLVTVVTGNCTFWELALRVNEFHKKGCQEKSSPPTGGREDFCLEIQPTSLHFTVRVPLDSRERFASELSRCYAKDHAGPPSRGAPRMSQIRSVHNATMEGAMLRILSVLCLIVMTTSAVRLSAQVYPYRDGTPDVTGYARK